MDSMQIKKSWKMLLLVNEIFPYLAGHRARPAALQFCLVDTYKPLWVFKYKHEGTISKSKIEVSVQLLDFIILLRVSSNLLKPQAEIFVQQEVGQWT